MSVALATDVAGSGRTGRAMGALGAASAVGTALGPAVGGVLIAGYGWRAIFAVVVPIAIAVLLLVARTVPSPPVRDVQARTRGGGARALWRSAGVRSAGMTSVIVAAVMMSTLVVGPFFLGASLGLGGAVVGLVLSVGPVVAALSGMPAGSIVDRVGAVVALRLGLAGMIAGCSSLAALAPLLGVFGFALSMAMLTASYALAQAANNTQLMTSVVQHQRGAAAGLLNATRNLGLVAGASGFGSLYAHVVGDVTHASLADGSLALRVTLLLSVAFLAAALVGARRATRAPGAPTR